MRRNGDPLVSANLIFQKSARLQCSPLSLTHTLPRCLFVCVVVFLQLQGGQGNSHREGLHPYRHDIIAEVYHDSAAAKVSKYQPLFIPSIEPLFTIWSRIKKVFAFEIVRVLPF